MSLKKALQDGVAKIFEAMDDLVTSVTYNSVVPGVYNPVTDTYVSTNVTLTCDAVEYKAKEETAEWKKTELNEVRFLIDGAHFVTNSVTPKEDDFITVGAVKYEIMTIRPMPKNVAYIFVTRRS